MTHPRRLPTVAALAVGLLFAGTASHTMSAGPRQDVRLSDLHVSHQFNLFEWLTEPGDNSGSLRGAVLPDGEFLVLDLLRRRVLRFDHDARWVGEWGGSGVEEGLLAAPAKVVVDAEGTVFLVDRLGATEEGPWIASRVSRFAVDGRWLGDAELDGLAPDELPVDIAAARGDRGGVWVLVYSLASRSSRVMRLDGDGHPDGMPVAVPERASAVEALADGALLVAAPSGVVRVEPSGAVAQEWGPDLAAALGSAIPRDLAVMPNGRIILLTDAYTRSGNHYLTELLVADASGAVQARTAVVCGYDGRTWKVDGQCSSVDRVSSTALLLSGARYGAVLAQVDGTAIASDVLDRRSLLMDFILGLDYGPVHLDARGGAWVCCRAAETVRKAPGILRIAETTSPEWVDWVASSSRRVLHRALGSTLDGEMLVESDMGTTASRRIEHYDLAGTFKRGYSPHQTANEDFRLEAAFDLGDGQILASGYSFTDPGRFRILSQSGVIARFGAQGSAPGEVSGRAGVVALTNGNLAVADAGGGRIQELARNGSWLSTWPTPDAARPDLRLSAMDIDRMADGSLISMWRASMREPPSSFRGDELIQTTATGGVIGRLPLPHASSLVGRGGSTDILEARGDEVLIGDDSGGFTVFSWRVPDRWRVEHFANDLQAGMPVRVETAAAPDVLELAAGDAGTAGWSARALRTAMSYDGGGALRFELSGIGTARLWAGRQLVASHEIDGPFDLTGALVLPEGDPWLRLDAASRTEGARVALELGPLPTHTATATRPSATGTPTPTIVASPSPSRAPDVPVTHARAFIPAAGR